MIKIRDKGFILMRILLVVIFFPLFSFSNEQEINKIKQRLDALRGKELSVLEEIEKIDHEIIILENEIADLKIKERYFFELSKKKEKEFVKVKKDFDKERKRLKNILSVIYMFRFFNPFQIFLQKPKDLSFTDLSRIIYISKLSNEKIRQMEKMMEKVRKSEREFKKSKENYQRAIKSGEYKLLELNQKKKEKKNLIENIRIEKDRYLSLLKELKKASEGISEKISKVEPSPFPQNLVSIREKKGLLPWPVEGKVVQKFGLVKNKKYNTFVKNIGIILSPRHENVKAVWWGKVIFADYFEGYGNVVIIEHQDRIYSIYGYLGTIFVKKGENVNTGQVIAKVGSSGLASEDVLYFEIREGNEPKNPLIWLSNK